MPDKIFNSEYLADRKLPFCLLKRDPQESYALHSHEFAELVIVFRGRGKHIVFGEKRTVEGGDVFLIRHNIQHGYENIEDLALYNIIFDMRNVNNPLHAFGSQAVNSLFQLEPEPGSGKTLRLPPEKLAEVLTIVKSMEEEQARCGELFTLGMTALFAQLTVLLARCYRRGNTANSGDEAIYTLLNQLTVQPEKEWSRKAMARAAKCSESTLSRKFKSCTGYAPLEYLIILRLKKGAMLLANTDMSVTEAAEQSGFTDCTYFCRQFKRLFGCSPGKYRTLSE